MFRPLLLSRSRGTVTASERDQQQHAEEDPARSIQTASRALMTLASICTSSGKNDHATHLSFSQLEWTAQSPLKPRERQREFKARQIVIHGDLALDPLGVKDIQQAGRALAKTQLGDAQRFLRLF